MNNLYQPCILRMEFKKEGITLARPHICKCTPMLGEAIPILPKLTREVVEIVQEDIGEYTLTHIELEPESQGRIRSEWLIASNFLLHPAQMWSIFSKKNIDVPKKYPEELHATGNLQ